jgi:hypothetical protein
VIGHFIALLTWPEGKGSITATKLMANAEFIATKVGSL